MLELGTIKISPDSGEPDIPSPIRDVIHQFRVVFEFPDTLPPAWVQDHAISLLPAAAPVNVRPYRYPHFQKNEIERLVQEMLATGIIQPRTLSLFPVWSY